MNEKILPYNAPAFNLMGTDNKVHQLEDYKGHWIVVYFYPKDDTPGCTTEACSLRDNATELLESDVEIFGVSADDVASHIKFKNKHHLNFVLLSDPEKKTIKEYGAWGKTMFGKEGILRKTFIINPYGEVVKVYKKVTPLGHGLQVLNDIRKLKNKL